MSKHRAPRNRIHFLIAGCSLALATIFVLLAHYVGHSVITPPVSANVASQIMPDTPPATPDLQPLVQLEQQRQQADQARERAALAQADAERKAAADAAAAAAAARKAAADKAAAEAAKAAADRAAAEAAAKAKADAAAAAKPTPPPPPAPARGTTVAAYQAYAQGKVDATQFSCLVTMWNNESGWNPNAQNPSSTAYGIPQFLDSTWAGTGYAKTSDPYTQIDAGLVYIAKAYGTPCSAWGFWQANHYY